MPIVRLALCHPHVFVVKAFRKGQVSYPSERRRTSHTRRPSDEQIDLSVKEVLVTGTALASKVSTGSKMYRFSDKKAEMQCG